LRRRFSVEEVFEQIKPASRQAYKKCLKEFKEINPEINFEEGPPGEEAIVHSFRGGSRNVCHGWHVA
jgi:hypothetical protein